VTSGAQEVSTHIKANNVGQMVARLVRRTQSALATPLNPTTNRRQLGMRTW
jgi:hypothetical protein